MEKEGCICLTNKYSALCFSGDADTIQKEVKHACKCQKNCLWKIKIVRIVTLSWQRCVLRDVQTWSQWSGCFTERLEIRCSSFPAKWRSIEMSTERDMKSREEISGIIYVALFTFKCQPVCFACFICLVLATLLLPRQSQANPSLCPVCLHESA